MMATSLCALAEAPGLLMSVMKNRSTPSDNLYKVVPGNPSLPAQVGQIPGVPVVACQFETAEKLLEYAS